MTIDQIKDRIAELLKWDRKEVDSFSLPTLREFVRGKDHEFDLELQDFIHRGQHLFTLEE